MRDFLRCLAGGLLLVASAGAETLDAQYRERIRLELAFAGGETEVLVLDEFETFPVGESRTVRATSGSEALVTRHAERLEVELHGRRIEVALDAAAGPGEEALTAEIARLREAAGGEARQVIVVHADHEAVVHGGETLEASIDGEAIRIDAARDGAGERRQVIVQPEKAGVEGEAAEHTALEHELRRKTVVREES